MNILRSGLNLAGGVALVAGGWQAGEAAGNVINASRANSQASASVAGAVEANNAAEQLVLAGNETDNPETISIIVTLADKRLDRSEAHRLDAVDHLEASSIAIEAAVDNTFNAAIYTLGAMAALAASRKLA